MAEDLSTQKQAAQAVDPTTATNAVDAALAHSAAGDFPVTSVSPDETRSILEKLLAKYDQERDRRLRADGLAQYTSLDASAKLKHFQDDPFAASEPHAGQVSMVKDGDSVQYLIMGAGMAGISAGVRLRRNGVAADDIWIIDSAGGFGGTWYWNRYPGLACDVESYIYLPFLEETSYMPKHKYSYGHEIRGYLNSVVDKYDLRRNAIFQAQISSTAWDEPEKRWRTTFTSKDSGGPITISSRFALFGPGVLHMPKVPVVEGLEGYKGDIFHTSRWDYGLTGGTEQQPDMEKLKNKNVAIVGTGATAVQAVPHLAKWAKKLYVIQRTPSAVDWRGNHATDPETFKREVATHPGWQYDRNLNFNRFLAEYPNVPDVNLVKDGWTYAPAGKGFMGGLGGPKSPQDIPKWIEELHVVDFRRAERLRQRVDHVVKDKETAEKLKAWYPTWCKRPTFNDEYLPTFNLSNVELLDTNGKSIEKFTESGIVVNGQDLQVDLIVLGTGYRSPGDSPAARANLQVIGRDGISLDDKYNSHWSTLHGTMSNGFPNLFLFSVSQFAVSANYAKAVDLMASNMIHILNKAREKAVKAGKEGADTLVIEPTAEAESAWGDGIAMRSMTMAAVGACTPGYLNGEGGSARLSPQQQMAAARKAPWAEGAPSFLKHLQAWEEEGALRGLEITV